MTPPLKIRPSVLCPIDFSEPSAGALRYAAAIARHVGGRLIVLTVEDPLLTAAMEFSTDFPWDPKESKTGLADFVGQTLGGEDSADSTREYEVAVGKPAGEILRVARERACDLIVISTHGLTGARKLFFGSTTERVLRETTRPVLLTPPANSSEISLENIRHAIGRIVVPVDLSPASLDQTRAASGLAEALDVPLVLVHVIEPVRSRLVARINLAGLDADRKAVAEDRLIELLATIPVRIRREALIARGDPAEEAAKVAHDRRAGLVVVGLHGSPLLGPRMGSVTYRLICLSPTLVLALPPKHVTHQRVEKSAAVRPPARRAQGDHPDRSAHGWSHSGG